MLPECIDIVQHGTAASTVLEFLARLRAEGEPGAELAADQEWLTLKVPLMTAV
jgi:hypothetical protein